MATCAARLGQYNQGYPENDGPPVVFCLPGRALELNVKEDRRLSLAALLGTWWQR